MEAINILETKFKPCTPLSSMFESTSYTHHGDDECPVCHRKMIFAKVRNETVLFCPDHRITFPQRED